MICPQEWQDPVNRLAEGLGHGPNNMSAPLSANGQLPVTHYGCLAVAKQEFYDLARGAGNGIIPSVDGMTEQEVASTLSNLLVDLVLTSEAEDHFNKVIGRIGLQKIAAE
jgi:hypothetical protein